MIQDLPLKPRSIHPQTPLRHADQECHQRKTTLQTHRITHLDWSHELCREQAFSLRIIHPRVHKIHIPFVATDINRADWHVQTILLECPFREFCSSPSAQLNQRVFIGVRTFNFDVDENGREVCEEGCLIDGRGLVKRRGGSVVSAALEGRFFGGTEM